MKVLHVGSKNYPPAHGGVEKVVFDIIQNSENIMSYVFVEWPQPESETTKVMPAGILQQICLIFSFIKINSVSLIHFHKETFIPHGICMSLMGKRSIITLHGCAWRIARWAWYYRLAFYILDIMACIFVSKVVFVGKEDYRHFSKIVFWRKLHHVSNGIDANAAICSDDTNQCVFIGRISPEKNVLRLIDMFSSGDKKLTLYGPFDKHDKSYKGKVLAAIDANANVSYGGVLSHTEIIPTLAKFNTFYNVSFSEGMPVAVLEAASVGLNLVLSNIPQHTDLKFPDAVYVDPHSFHIVENFSGKSMRNKNHVEKHYSIRRTLESYKRLYNEIRKSNEE